MTDIRHLFSCLGLLLMLVACGSSDDIEKNTVLPDNPVSGDEPSKVSLAFAVSSTAGQTRSSAAIVQVSGFRGITPPTLLTFQVHREVQKDDKGYPASVSEVPDIDGKDAKFFFYNDFEMPIGIAALLVYAKAKAVTIDGKTDKAANGSTIASIPTNTTPAYITFSPDNIYSGTTIHTGAQAIANYLTAIANTESWNDELRQNFIGKGDVAPTLIAGSSASVNAYVAKLVTELDKLSDSKLKTAIMANIDKKPGQLTDATKYYPASIGLPDGAAALKWVETTTDTGTTGEFVPQTTTTLKDVNSLNVFAYPAELCYFSNSQIKTSESVIDHTGYTSTTDWKGDVLPKYTDGQSIVRTTKSVAIEKPLQYGVARLDVALKANTIKATISGETKDVLVDGDGNNVVVEATSFPLTGVIVGGQRRVGFDYRPLSDSDPESMVYDSKVFKDPDTNDNPKYDDPIYLLPTADEKTFSASVHTLLLQSLDREDETIILEFENNSGTTFKGIDGLINPGTKFYLIGTILKPTEVAGQDQTKRVFTQDYITTANVTIESLSRAYNAVPDLYYDALTSFQVVRIDIKPWSESSAEHTVYNW